MHTFADLIVTLPSVCPVAPPGAQQYADTITGYVLWGVLVLLGLGSVTAVGAIVGGRVFAMPHASRVGVISIAVVFMAAILYMVLPPMIGGVTGSGCV
jgi:hypothetical protein